MDGALANPQGQDKGSHVNPPFQPIYGEPNTQVDACFRSAGLLHFFAALKRGFVIRFCKGL